MAENELLNSTAVDTANEYDASEIQVLEGLEACLLYTSRCV